jgi:hypothetical protein
LGQWQNPIKIVERGKIDSPKTQINDRSLFVLGTRTAIESVGGGLVLWNQTSTIEWENRFCLSFMILYLILELFRQSGIFEMFRQSGIFELFRQSGIFELFRQSGIFELFRQDTRLSEQFENTRLSEQFKDTRLSEQFKDTRLSEQFKNTRLSVIGLHELLGNPTT